MNLVAQALKTNLKTKDHPRSYTVSIFGWS